ncbi:hypothetical protein [Chryseobacterium sp. BIGb0232]|uniref:hypothetical protein n=1 Tax=Chryseobacterium sp. BIGb0232 TaxID=2940598 RepID=UPI000F47EFAC|nr:hypothetical protein [Chryseobacterium sp. BIGb0232]MCS4301835.1 hypothetical protein [Chryseobacterium sp. BIGb0232]
MKIAKILSILSLLFFCLSCSNDDNIFHLKTIRINEYEQYMSLPEQHLFIKIVDHENSGVMAETEPFQSNLHLPLLLKTEHVSDMNLYARPYRVELWGDISGLIGSCTVKMDDYRITFPIDMEVKSNSLEVAIQGSWE